MKLLNAPQLRLRREKTNEKTKQNNKTKQNKKKKQIQKQNFKIIECLKQTDQPTQMLALKEQYNLFFHSLIVSPTCGNAVLECWDLAVETTFPMLMIETFMEENTFESRYLLRHL